MIDESTDVSFIGHIMIFVSFIKDGLSVSDFLSINQIENEEKDCKEIYKALLAIVKK